MLADLWRCHLFDWLAPPGTLDWARALYSSLDGTLVRITQTLPKLKGSPVPTWLVSHVEVTLFILFLFF